MRPAMTGAGALSAILLLHTPSSQQRPPQGGHRKYYD
jgi:hypothetical protein